MYYKRKMKFCTNNALYKFLCNRFLLFPSNPVDRLFSYSPIHSSISLIPIALNWSNKLIAEAVSPSLLSRNFPDGLPKKKKKKEKYAYHRQTQSLRDFHETSSEGVRHEIKEQRRGCRWNTRNRGEGNGEEGLSENRSIFTRPGLFARTKGSRAALEIFRGESSPLRWKYPGAGAGLLYKI